VTITNYKYLFQSFRVFDGAIYRMRMQCLMNDIQTRGILAVLTQLNWSVKCDTHAAYSWGGAAAGTTWAMPPSLTQKKLVGATIHLPHQMACTFVITALHGMQTRSSDENSVCLSVCPSVCLSNARFVTKWQKDRSIFLYHTKDHSA